MLTMLIIWPNNSGFQAHVKYDKWTYSVNTTEVDISITRSTLVKTYAIAIVMTMCKVFARSFILGY